MRNFIETELLNLGCSPGRKGYAYTVRALELLMNDDSGYCINKDLYSLIAAESCVTALSVERNIRGFVQQLWDNGDREMLCKLFGRRYEKFRPSNKEFLCMASRRFLIQMHACQGKLPLAH